MKAWMYTATSALGQGFAATRIDNVRRHSLPLPLFPHLPYPASGTSHTLSEPDIRTSLPLALCLAAAFLAPAPKTLAEDVEHYAVYCADDRIEISFWELEQMKVRRGSDVCQFARYTSSSSAMDFARKNFGGEGSPCSC